MSAKKKKKQLPTEFKTCIVAMIIFFVLGSGILIYGKLWNNVSADDIKTVQATIVAIDKIPSDNSKKTKESLKENGFSQEEVDYDFEIEYEFTLDGETHTHLERVPYRRGQELNIGDTTELNYTIKRGEVVVNPSPNGVYTGFGLTFLAFSVLSSICAFILRPKKH